MHGSPVCGARGRPLGGTARSLPLGAPPHCAVRLQVDRYEEYPKMRELIQRKDSLVAQRATPPYFIQVGSRTLPTLWQLSGPRPRDFAESAPHPASGNIALAAVMERDRGRPAHPAAFLWWPSSASSLQVCQPAKRAQSVSQQGLCHAGGPAGAQAGRADLRHQV